jgi:hypothetical protein
MFGQFPDWFWLWLDWLWFEFAVELELVLEPADDEEELPLAALAIAAPPPAMTPSAATVARPIRNRFMVVHLLSSHLVDSARVNRRSLRAG